MGAREGAGAERGGGGSGHGGGGAVSESSQVGQRLAALDDSQQTPADSVSLTAVAHSDDRTHGAATTHGAVASSLVVVPDDTSARAAGGAQRPSVENDCEGGGAEGGGSTTSGANRLARLASGLAGSSRSLLAQSPPGTATHRGIATHPATALLSDPPAAAPPLPPAVGREKE